MSSRASIRAGCMSHSRRGPTWPSGCGRCPRPSSGSSSRRRLFPIPVAQNTLGEEVETMPGERPATPSLREIAEAAGVSVATVSRALAGRGDLKRETRERVQAIAHELAYERPTSRRGRPATLDARLIELVLGTFDDAWTNEV